MQRPQAIPECSEHSAGIVARIESIVFHASPFNGESTCQPLQRSIKKMSSIRTNDWTLRRYPTDDIRTYPPDSLLRLNQVCEIVGKKKSSLYKAIADGEFPKPKKIGKRAVAWSANVVFQWIAERPSAR